MKQQSQQSMAKRFPSVQYDAIVCGGGLDQITPTLSLKNGFARSAINFECGTTGGYTKIDGYERFDGHQSPSAYSIDIPLTMISVASWVTTPVVGNTITASGGKSAVVAFIRDKAMALAKVTGTFAVNDVLMLGASTVGTVDNINAGPITPLEDAQARNAVADIYRADITAVPGSGPVRGVVMLSDTIYAFRNAADGLSCAIYKSSSSGWTNVPLLKSVRFTSGGTAVPAAGATLTQGGVTATVKRVVKESGAWTGSSAAGRLIITTPAGGNFTSGAATAGSTNLTLSGAQTSITIQPGGKYEMIVDRFSELALAERVYGTDGVNPAFEFDGETYVPILTGISPDAPKHIISHRNYLWLSFGASMLWSNPGDPYNWQALTGAGEIACGENITGFVTMPGENTTAALGVFSRNSTFVLYGTSPDDFNFVSFSSGSGANSYTARNMSETLAYDDHGVVSIQAAIRYGNFSQSTVTSTLLQFIREQRDKCTYATLNRNKSQYRVFFNTGYGLYCTLVNGKSLGSMPVYYPNYVFCAYDGKTSTGEDVAFFGSDNGFVYQFDKGTSFDGEPMDFQLVLNYTSAKNPRTLKTYKRAAIELAVTGVSYIDMYVGYALGFDSIEYEQYYANPEALFLSNSDNYTKYMSSARWDTFTWDDFFWDTRGLSPMEVELGGTAENIAMAFSGHSDYTQPFTINGIVLHYIPRRSMR